MLLFVAAELPVVAQQTPATGETGYVVESYYRVQWGHQQEFLELFFKNYYPLIKKNIEAGRVLSAAVETPTNHMTEDSRWDYRLTVRYRDSTVATTANSEEESWIVQLWPDQARYKREEQRRFEILAAHWDMAIATVLAPATK
jgi:hypothetical protein